MEENIEVAKDPEEGDLLLTQSILRKLCSTKENSMQAVVEVEKEEGDFRPGRDAHIFTFSLFTILDS